MHIQDLYIYTMSLKMSVPVLTRLDKSSATTALFKLELEEWKNTLQSILYLFFQDHLHSAIHFAIGFAQLIDHYMQKLLCSMKMKTADHRVSALLVPGSGGQDHDF